MKAKKIKIKTIDDGLADFAKAFKNARYGKTPKPKTGVFFSSVEAVRRVLTVKRITLLKYIKKHEPNSIYELAKGLGKNFKNVCQDLRYLAEIGLIELQESHRSRRQLKPRLISDHITLELVI